MGTPIVRVFTLDEIDSDGLSGRFDDPSGHIRMCDATWAEMVRANPAAQGPDLTMLLALDGDRVVGRLGFHAGTAWVRGARHRIHWMDGYFLDEAYRNSGVGGLIMLQASARCKSILACGGPSDAAQKLYKAAGMKEIGPLRRWLHFPRGIGPARKVLGAGPLAAAASPLAGAALRAFYASRRRGERPRLSYRRVERFDQQIDALQASPPLPCFPRDAATLNWALSYRRLRAFEVRRAESGPLIGYVLLKRNRMDLSAHGLGTLTTGWLVDHVLATPTPAEKRDLVLFVIDHFRADPGDGSSDDERGPVDVIDVQTFDPEVDAACRSLGMVHKGGLRVLFRPPPGVALPQDGRWFLTAAAGDMLLAPP